MIPLLAQDGYEIAEGLRVLSGMLKPYPWWYWTLVFAGNIPVYLGLVYLMFGSRERFREVGKYMLMSKSEMWELGNILPGMVAFFWLWGWVGVCVAAIIAQHHLLWKGLFGDM